MNKEILILDDEQECVSLLKSFLGEFKYKITVALYPKHALEIMEKSMPSTVLFDYKMPEMDGDKFLEKAKQISPSTTFILMTAYRDDATIERFLGLGVAAVLMKPIDLEKVLSLLPQQ